MDLFDVLIAYVGCGVYIAVPNKIIYSSSILLKSFGAPETMNARSDHHKFGIKFHMAIDALSFH